ncbi:hypothetical protein H0H87_009235 [Tephrocybe sp. NHM501043]|nr:hypothetical protein H0H87_009235 [Tephrocybe sp. NHM501043]
MDAEPSSDPILLFTPEKFREEYVGRVLSPRPSNPTPIPPERTFFILAPHLPDEEKKLYKPVQETSLRTYSEVLLDEVIGRYHEHNILYYYARYKGGLAHKVRKFFTCRLPHLTRLYAQFPAKPFLKEYEKLVDEFERKEAAGDLKPFDPSAQDIDPLSRVKLTVSISKRRPTASISSVYRIKSTPGTESLPDSQDEDTMEGNYNDENYESDSEEIEEVLTQNTRSSGRQKRALPFSPRKTRSARFVLPDSDMETGASEKSVIILPSRRSTRSSRNQKKLEEAGSEVDSGDDEISVPRSKPKPKNLARKKEARPAYGHFRSVTDLDNDLHFGEEIGPTQKHRDICEKCHQVPAHKLLRALAKKGKQRSKKKADEFEGSEDEEERLAALGGWVRCLKCPVVAHWKCLASTQRDEILKAARDKDIAEWKDSQLEGEGAPRNPEPGKHLSLNTNQTTEFICGNEPFTITKKPAN